MTNDFKDFVDSYRCSDSVGCERGYYNVAPVWKVNKQHKYVNCWAEQLFQINENHNLQLLHTYRGSRCHRSYPLDMGKDASPRDLYMEVQNRDIKLMSPVRSIAGHVR